MQRLHKAPFLWLFKWASGSYLHDGVPVVRKIFKWVVWAFDEASYELDKGTEKIKNVGGQFGSQSFGLNSHEDIFKRVKKQAQRCIINDKNIKSVANRGWLWNNVKIVRHKVEVDSQKANSSFLGSLQGRRRTQVLFSPSTHHHLRLIRDRTRRKTQNPWKNIIVVFEEDIKNIQVYRNFKSLQPKSSIVVLNRTGKLQGYNIEGTELLWGQGENQETLPQPFRKRILRRRKHQRVAHLVHRYQGWSCWGDQKKNSLQRKNSPAHKKIIHLSLIGLLCHHSLCHQKPHLSRVHRLRYYFQP